MKLDDRGNLIMSPSRADNVRSARPDCPERLANENGMKNLRTVTKQYHISDFRFPYVPDHDQQELPYSKGCLPVSTMNLL